METAYRIAIEDNGKEVECPGVLQKRFGLLGSFTEAQAHQKIVALRAFLEGLDTLQRGAMWSCGNRLFSFRRGERVRTYSIAPIWFNSSSD